MARLLLDPPDWDALVGGTEDESKWLANQNRKFALASEYARELLDAERQIRQRNAVFKCSPQVLAEVRLAGYWYVSLIGLSLKNLRQIRRVPANFGLQRNPETVVDALRRGKHVPDPELEAFSNWINSEIGRLFPEESRDEDQACATALLTIGGGVDGVARNVGGDDAVVLVKSLLAGALSKRGRFLEIERPDGSWVQYDLEYNLLRTKRLRIDKRMIVELVGGGNRPDLSVSLKDTVIAVGEIKGRVDLSNLWESWMPTIADHLRSWSQQYEDSARLFFGTVISQEMVSGISLAEGTPRVGLRELHERGWLTGAYNLSKIAEKDSKALWAFDHLVGRLMALLDGGG